jgi:NAD(P)-dependent dehydrogenase (short-subunit alcohol dehydrogenase family)
VNPAGKLALVTGAASGIGRAGARLLASAGASVVVADVDERGGLETVAGIESTGGSAVFRSLDVSQAAAIGRLFDELASEFGGLAILFNCAGLVSGQPDFPDTPGEVIAGLVAVNVTGTVLATRAAIAQMGDSRGGVIVNVSSTAALMPAHPDPVYAASKAAVKTFTEQCAGAALARGVRVNAVLPGAVDTPIIAKTGAGGQPASWLAARLPKIQLLSAGAVAAEMLDLVEDETRTGALVVVSNSPAATT